MALAAKVTLGHVDSATIQKQEIRTASLATHTPDEPKTANGVCAAYL